MRARARTHHWRCPAIPYTAFIGSLRLRQYSGFISPRSRAPDLQRPFQAVASTPLLLSPSCPLCIAFYRSHPLTRATSLFRRSMKARARPLRSRENAGRELDDEKEPGCILVWRRRNEKQLAAARCKQIVKPRRGSSEARRRDAIDLASSWG